MLRLKDHLGWWRRPLRANGAAGKPTPHVRDV